MLRSIATRANPSWRRGSRRCFATVSTVITPIPGSYTVPPAPLLDETYPRNPTSGKPGALRPTWDIPVDPKHGLWAFFRFQPKSKNKKHGEYITVEPPSQSELLSGRAWSVAELRRKNFQDLHIIWYQCQRELNLLRTMEYNYKRIHVRHESALNDMKQKMRMCRKTCARIKLVLNERRLAFDDATARVRYLHRPGWKDPEQDPFAKDRQENYEIVRKVRHYRQQWSRIKLRERRRRHRRKLAWLARQSAKRTATTPDPSTTATGESSGTAVAADSVPVPPAQRVRPKSSARRMPRMIYPLLKKPMTQKAINKALHKIKNRHILHRGIKNHLHFTLKANKWGRFPRARRTYNAYVDQ